MSPFVWRAVLGLGLGAGLSFIGFADFEQVHRMFLFEDLRLFLTFMGAVACSAVGFWLMRRARVLPPRPMNARVVPGGMLFGAGWALCGACPGIVLVQLGEGRPYALITLLGLLGGNAVYGWVERRKVDWDAAACAE
jgi:uncharacterized membrane protein YedE/YeeE